MRLRLLSAAFVARCAGLLGLRLKLLHPVAELVHPGLRLRVGAPPLGVDGRPHPVGGRAKPAFQLPHPLPRHLADLVPPFLDPLQLGLRGLEVGGRIDLLGFDEELLLQLGIRSELGVALGERLRTAAEEPVLRGAEALPQRLVAVLRRATGSLPLSHQLLVSVSGFAPVGGLGQRLGFLDQLLLVRLGRRALPVEFGEVRAPTAAEGVPRLGEPAPQLLVGFAVDTADLLPFLEDLAQPVARRLPVRGLVGDLLGLDDQRFLACDRVCSGAFFLVFGTLDGLLGPGHQMLDPGVQRRQVADHGGFGQRLVQVLRAGQGVLRLPGVGAQPGLQQLDLGEQVVELACVEGQALGGVTGLPGTDRPLTVGGADIHRAVGVHPTPFGGIGGSGRYRGRSRG